jgi:oxalate decarboxylase/phosphoglucose isomerase-like protein (cupin superfamily)
VFEEPRGKLTLVEADRIPFSVRRTYALHELPRGARRGGHACRTQHRLLVGLRGRVEITLDDGLQERTIAFAPGDTLLITPRTWHELLVRDDGAAVLVFAEGDYDSSEYVSERSALPLGPVEPSS